MKKWWATAEMADAGWPSMPTTDRAFRTMAKRENWSRRKNLKDEPLARRRSGRGGGLEYHFSLLPDFVQAHIVKADAASKRKASKKERRDHVEAWDHFERLNSKQKERAKEKLKLIKLVQTLHLQGGLNKDDAVAHIAAENRKSKSTIYNWYDAVAGIDEKDWLPYLVDRRGGKRKSATYNPQIFDAIKADYLRLSKPSFSTCYERVKSIADDKGWDMPCERTLYRRIEAEVPAAVRILCRDGEEALKRSYPAQERDRSMFHALEAVNADGHKWDVFVRWPDGSIIRPMMLAIQDLYSNKILAWRLDKSENSDVVRLAFADVFRNFGIPDYAWLDNGRGFASKFITGGSSTRFRFKVRPEDPTGILTNLGIKTQWTTPYSGQSKPIERAFRDMCDAIAKHPEFEGAYTGNKVDAKPENYGSRAIDFETFIRVVGQGINAHNARPKRNTRVCGRTKSFDQAFDDSYATALIKKATNEQLRQCLLAADVVRTDRRNGSFKLLGDNRYWADEMSEHIGRAVTVRFDPDNLYDDVYVYRQDGSFICRAPCIEAVGFADTEAARDHGRKRREYMKITKRAAELERSMNLDDFIKLLPDINEPETPEANTIQIVQVGNTLTKQKQQKDAAEEADDLLHSVGAGLRLIDTDQI